MNTTNTLQLSPFQLIGRTLGWLLRFIVLDALYCILFSVSGQIVGPYLPNTIAEPGPLPLMTALFITSTAITAIIMLTVHSSRWRGWKLILSMSVTYYLVLTVVTQLEAWYFLYGITVGPELMVRLFLQGIPVALIFIPITVLIWDAFALLRTNQHYPKSSRCRLRNGCGSWVLFVWSISQSIIWLGIILHGKTPKCVPFTARLVMHFRFFNR